ncbi:MAG: leucine-rich repeat protein, partial [Bacteroidales bacterium]|nr:leucine-rich repeat protein [Bacteroidales bacterium]
MKKRRMLLMIALAVMMPMKLRAFYYENIQYQPMSTGTTQIMELSAKSSSNFYYTKGHNVVNVSGDVVIPATVYDEGNALEYSVVGFGDNCFRSNTKITSINLPETVTFINQYAFHGCTGLKCALKLPEGLTSIGTYAFYNCSGLTGELIFKSLTSIGTYAFYNCSGLNSVTLNEGLTSIGNYAFYGCNGFKGDLILPESLTSLGTYAFYNCSGFTGELILPRGITTIGTSTFEGCSGFTGKLIIPEGVSSIGNSAFRDMTGITSISIPSSVESIGNNAFNIKDESNLKEINIVAGDNVLNIPSNAFNKSTSNEISLNLGRNIEGSPFEGFTNLTSITLGEQVTSLPSNMFAGCDNISNIVFESATPPVLGEGCFSESAIKNVIATVPNESLNSYRENDNYMFVSYDLIDPLIKTVDSVEYKVIFGKTESDDRIVVTGGKPDGNGNLTIEEEIEIDGKKYPVTAIEPDAFKDNTEIKSVTVPSTVKEIGEGAFEGCDNIDNIEFQGT